MCHATYDNVQRALENAKGNSLDIFYTLYCQYLASSEKPAAVLAQILQFEYAIGTEDAPAENISDAFRTRIANTYRRLLVETVHVLVQQNDPVDVFYKNLYANVFESSLFPQGGKERAVLLWLLSEHVPWIPYFQAENLLQQSNEDYKQAFERIGGPLQQAVHMINRRFPTRTEEASQLVRIADSITDQNDRIVYWSALIGIIRKAAKDVEGSDK